MEVGNKAVYDRQFRGNILEVGKTGWVTGIKIDDHTEAEIQACFSNKVEFHHAADLNELTELIETFKIRTRDIVNNESNSGFVEKISMVCLIVMDNVSGIADGSHKFAEFLTVCRKYRYHCIYGFHIIAPGSRVWKKMLSQRNIFNIFSSSVPYNTVAKILQSNCRQTTKKYVPVRSMWLSRAFVDLANTDKQHCLTIHCSGINKNSPGGYWTQASDLKKQVCYFN